jgi:PAS domain S-box-containing protein
MLGEMAGGAGATLGDDALEPGVVRFLIALSRGLAVGVTLMGATVLGGWVFDVSMLKSIYPSLATMKPNTALGLACLGATMLLQDQQRSATARRRTRALALITALIGAATLSEDILGWDLGIDQLVAHDRLSLRAPGRMSPATATLLTILGCATGLPRVPYGGFRDRVFQWLALASTLASLLALLGYLYGVRSLYAIAPFSSIALQTAFPLLAASVAALLSHEDASAVRLLAARDPGGVLTRRLLPAAVVVPILVGWLRLQGQRAGLYGTEFGLALFVTSNVVLFSLLVVLVARALRRSDQVRSRAEADLRKSEDGLAITLSSIRDAVIATDADGCVTRMNPAAEALTGWRLADALGKPLAVVFRIVDQDSKALVENPADRVLAGGDEMAKDVALIGRDGIERAIAPSGAPIKDQSGTTRGVVLVFQDQSEKRRADRALQRSEARFRRLTESGILGIVVSDLEGNIREANDAFLSIVGYSAEDLAAGTVSGRTLNTPERDRTDAVARAELLATGVARPWEK